MAKNSLQIVMDTDSYNLDVPKHPNDLFQEFLYLSSERNIEREPIDEYFRQKIYQIVWSSNAIENAGEKDLYSVIKLCHYVFEGVSPVNGQLRYTSEKSLREVVNHVKAATYILSQISIKKDLSEDMILDTHAILTSGIDTESTA